ncbi:AMP-binding protein [Sphingomonas crocodyli]|uniref:Long-chain fatty acid--CoA ligase n=1 Tax=Sphingomonas crocodyli TaxID=1979270 RepID=A0A437M919_9SPHN|nr:AMP-binding protein [Sphingomonas crocodyli]RVT94208.1 long-chain fatty acid--CoA ligase [Sphingomonas crocodyli]
MIAPDLTILTDDAQRTAGELADRVARAASGIAARGIGAGDCVALPMRNDIAFIEASLACRRLGAYCVPINWHSSPEEVRYIVADCGATLLIGHADLLVAAGATGIDTIGVAVAPAIAKAYRVADPALPADVEAWDDFIAGQALYAGPPAPQTEALIYTSGTTGHPKGVQRRPATPEQAVANDHMRQVVFRMGKGVRALVPAPLYHNAPNLVAHRAAALGELLVLPARFDAQGLLADIARHRITHVYAVPAMFKRMLALPEEVRAAYDLSSLQVILHAGGPCAPALKQAMIDWLGPVIEEYYGSTEAGPITRVSSEEWLARPGTVGRAIEGMDLHIVTDDGGDAAPGEIGEIMTRSAHFPDFTYLNRGAERSALDRNGLLASGDLGYVEDGWLFLCDRKRDMVVSGGVNIYPAEIEAALLAVPGVADCAVFGIPDEEYSEALLAIVQPDPGAELTGASVQQALRDRIAGYKIPRQIEFRESLPREETGKIKKRLLREPYWAAAGRRI